MEIISSGIEQLGFEELHLSNLWSLLSCRCCAKILKEPVTTGCGISYCRACIEPAPAHVAECPIDGCRSYTHGNCCVDITLQNVIWELRDVLQEKTPSLHKRYDSVEDLQTEKESDIPDDKDEQLSTTQEDLLPIVQKTLESDSTTMQCAICLNRLLDPVTTKCGHTFCQNCLRRNIDQIAMCPACRTRIDWQFETGPSTHHDPLAKWSYNHHLASIISTCWRPWVIERQQIINTEESLVPPDMDIPLFVCTNAYPGCYTYLRVFEPRYKLLIRRVMNSPDRAFGMIGTTSRTSDGIAEYGTIVKVVSLEHSRHQEIIIKTEGILRFKAKEKVLWDGYYTASIDPIVDDPIDWDHRERTPSATELLRLEHHGYRTTPPTVQWVIKLYQDNVNLVKCLTNSELSLLIKDYIKLKQEDGNSSVTSIFTPALGGPPKDDEHLLWLFAHVHDFSSDCGIPMLKSTKIRDRLSMVLWWIVNHVPHRVWPVWFPQTPFPGGPPGR